MYLTRALIWLSIAVTPPVWAQARAGDAAPSNELVVTLYNQIEALQQEVQTLRGVVEEQGFQLKRLQNEQRDRYLDVDRRLSALTPIGPAGSGIQLPVPTGQEPQLPPPDLRDSSAALSDSTVVTQTPPPVTATPAAAPNAEDSGLDELELYRNALDLLLEESKYSESIAQFQLYIDKFPKGRLYTNALYWQGEAYLLVPANAEAIAVFQRLLNEFPQDAKAAGAMYKMGIALKQMGDVAKAGEIWREIKVKYPESANEIRLADEALRAL